MPAAARTAAHAAGAPAASAPPPPPPGPPAIRVTPELVQSLRENEPLVRAVMDQLGAQVIKVE